MTARVVRRGPDGERGAFIVLWALLLTGLMIMVAIAIDLGNARAVKRSDQEIADFAALAAGNNLATSPSTACSDAWNYITANLSGLPSGAGSPCGSGFPTSCNDPGTSSPTAAQNFVATGTGAYGVTFRYPVSDRDIADSRFSSPTSDLTPCKRFKVTVAQTSQSFFGGVVGESQRTTTASAVMVANPGQSKFVPSLWLLDPTGCQVLNVQGNGAVNVGNSSQPGFAVVDSDGSGCTSGYGTIYTGANSSNINAVGTGASINAYASGANGPSACVYPACGGFINNIQPPPARSTARAGRSPADYKYDCRWNVMQGETNYTPTYLPATAPCSDAASYGYRIDYITQMTTLMTGSDATVIARLTAESPTWSGYTAAGYSCSPNGNLLMPIGNWIVDCPNGFNVTSNVTFRGNVVFTGSVSVKNNSGVLTVGGSGNTLPTTCQLTTAQPRPMFCPDSSSTNTAAYVYIKGDLSGSAGGSLVLNNTAVIQPGGVLNFTSQTSVNWTPPSDGMFTSLSLWSTCATNGCTPGSSVPAVQYTLQSGGASSVSGIFFMPYANTFALQGGGGFQSFAQYVSYHLNVQGTQAGFNLVAPGGGLTQSSGQPALIR